MSLLERVYSFHQEILRDRYPNATTLIEQFEVSMATARRDIAYLRDRLLAPLAFDSKKNGFYYTDNGFSLPFSDSPKITLLLGMLNKFAEEAGLRKLPEVQQLESKLSSMLTADYPTLVQSLYCEWIEVESIDTSVFSIIVEAVVSQRAVIICYSTAGSASSSRCIEPQRLCNYQGRWYLLAHCRLRHELRMFHIARIGSAELTSEKISFLPDLEESYLKSSFGIFKGGCIEMAEILFSGTAAELIRHQHWHRDQQIENTPQGILLKLPVSDDREITMKILQYGAQAKVLAPESLQKKVAREIQSMTALYSDIKEKSITLDA
jgi:predicted DNA-binding transcriptional regulator YafY